MAEIPELPGCRAWGDTPEEAIEIISDLAVHFMEDEVTERAPTTDVTYRLSKTGGSRTAPISGRNAMDWVLLVLLLWYTGYTVVLMMKDDNVPKWFSDFAVQNQKEHGELAEKIASINGDLSKDIEKSKGDLRDSLTWRIVGAAVAVLSLNIAFMSLVLPKLLE